MLEIVNNIDIGICHRYNSLDLHQYIQIRMYKMKHKCLLCSFFFLMCGVHNEHKNKTYNIMFPITRKSKAEQYIMLICCLICFDKRRKKCHASSFISV